MGRSTPLALKHPGGDEPEIRLAILADALLKNGDAAQPATAWPLPVAVQGTPDYFPPAPYPQGCG